MIHTPSPHTHQRSLLGPREGGLLKSLPPRGQKEADTETEVARQGHQKQTGVCTDGDGNLMGELIVRKHRVPPEDDYRGCGANYGELGRLGLG